MLGLADFGDRDRGNDPIVDAYTSMKVMKHSISSDLTSLCSFGKL